MLAGPHPTIFAQEILNKNPFVDVILLREYEFSCLATLKSNFDKKKMRNIKGIAFKDRNKFIKNESELIDVNKLPFPDRENVPIENKASPYVYWDDFCQLKPCIQMHASRGCPFRCNFCLWNQVMYCNKEYRPINAEKIVDEIEYCKKKYNAKEIYFDDDTFTGNKKHVLEICDEIKKRKIKIKWSCMGDAMITDTEMIDAMHKAGCIGIKFGVESADKKILQKIGKPINFEKIDNFLKECSKRKIKTHATFIFGMIGETRKSMKKTLDYVKDIDIDSVQFSVAVPLPGTRYYDEMDKKGRVLSKNWRDYDGKHSIVNFELPNKEVEDFCANAVKKWSKHKKKDIKWLKRKMFFILRSTLNQGPRYFLQKSKSFFKSVFN
jgi:anaerobic magnesium-protoporphyrin IX monomethyl ester cyclase